MTRRSAPPGAAASGPAPSRPSGVPATTASGLGSVRLVRVGSLNPPKLEGVQRALAAYAPGVRVEGTEVASGVPDQPVGFGEIVAGARRRAEGAWAAGPCDLAVGYEDGLVELAGAAPGWWNVGCAAVLAGARLGLGLSSGFAYPPACAAEAAGTRAPIGVLFDRLWRARRADAPREASALSVGNVGKLSGGVLPRAEYTRHAVLCALLPFLHPDLYGSAGTP